MKPEKRAQIIAINRARAQDKEKADDLVTLLGALPPGQVKQLMKNEVCSAILAKYGIGEEQT